MAMNQVSSGARALDSGTTLKSRSDYGRNADGSRQSPASAWASRLVMLAVLVLFSLPLYWMIVSALKSPQELAQFPPTLFPSRSEERRVGKEEGHRAEPCQVASEAVLQGERAR